MDINVIALAGALILIGLIFGYTLKTGISPMPTSAKLRGLMLSMPPDELGGTIYELGAGWGTLALPLAEKYPSCRVIGYELSPVPWAVSRVRQALAKTPNLELRRKNYFAADLSDAALVVCYIHSDGMAKLKPKFEAELKPGALVLSNFFAIRGWTPVAEQTADDPHASKVYLYRVGD